MLITTLLYFIYIIMSVIVENITKTFGPQRALDNVSFTINSGEVVGFLGPNGAGKSTMMKIITGYLRPDSGKALVHGIEVSGNSTEAHRLIGYLPEHNPLYLDMYVKEYLSMVAGIYKVDNIRQRVADVIELTGLGPESHKLIGTLSKGYRQRVGLSQALVSDPKVVILDEPTTGLDPNQIIEIRQLIKNIGQQKTVMLSTHIMQEVEAICDKVIIIDHGHKRAEGSIDEIAIKANGCQIVDVEFAEATDSEALRIAVGADAITVMGNNRYRLTSTGDIRGSVFAYAVANKNTLLELRTEKSDMETLFHQLTI